MSTEQTETTEPIPAQQQQQGHYDHQLQTQQDPVAAFGDGVGATVNGTSNENSSSVKDGTPQQHGHGGPDGEGGRSYRSGGALPPPPQPTVLAPTMTTAPPPPPPPPYGIHNPWPQPTSQDQQQPQEEGHHQQQQNEPSMSYGYPPQPFINGAYWPSYPMYPMSHGGGATAPAAVGPEGVSNSAPAVPPADAPAAGQYAPGQFFPPPPPQYPPYPPVTYHMQVQHHYQHHQPMMMTHLPPPQGPPANLSDDDMKELIKESDLVLISDRTLCSDILLIAFAQLKPIVITERDRFSYYKDRPDGFVGLGCMHCGGLAGSAGYGRYFPASVRSLAQTTTAQTVTKHMSLKCLKCPKQIRETILSLQRQEKYSQQMMAMTGKSRSSQAYPFGSLEPKNDSSKWGKRKVFFQCLWDRLHKTFPKTNKSMEKSDNDDGTNSAFKNEAEKEKKNDDDDDDQIDDGKRPAVKDNNSKNDEPVNGTDSGTIHQNTTNNDDQDKKQKKDEEERSNDKSSSGKRKRNDDDDGDEAVV